MWHEVEGSCKKVYLFACEYSVLLAPFVEDCFAPFELSWHHCWKSIDCKCGGVFLDLNSTILTMSILMLVPHYFDHCSIVVSFEIREVWIFPLCSFSRFFWLFWIPWISIWNLGFSISQFLLNFYCLGFRTDVRILEWATISKNQTLVFSFLKPTFPFIFPISVATSLFQMLS